MFKYFFSLSCCFILLFPLHAQQELGTHFMRDIWQSGLTNPALVTDKKIEVALPGFYVNAAASGIKFGELVQTDANGVNQIQVSDVLASLEEDNAIQANLEIETIRFAIRLKELQLSFHHGIRLNSSFNYPRGLAEFIFLGNGGFVGQTLELGPDIQLTAYNEFAFGAARKFGKLGLGLRLKYLTGIGNASTQRRKVDLTTDEDIYQLTLDTDLLLNTSSYFKINELTSFDFDLGVNNFSGADIFTKNSGFALDLGLTYQLSDKLLLAASVKDLGKINWKENVTNYQSEKMFTYDGVILDSVFQNSNVPLEGTLDSLKEVIAFTETSENYSTTLPLKTYWSLSYQVNKRWTLGALAHTSTVNGNTDFAFAFSGRAQVSKVLSVGASYAIRNQRYDNLGLNFALHLGPVSIFAMTDNILSAVQPENSQSFNLRTGLNLAF